MSEWQGGWGDYGVRKASGAYLQTLKAAVRERQESVPGGATVDSELIEIVGAGLVPGVFEHDTLATHRRPDVFKNRVLGLSSCSTTTKRNEQTSQHRDKHSQFRTCSGSLHIRLLRDTVESLHLSPQNPTNRNTYASKKPPAPPNSRAMQIQTPPPTHQPTHPPPLPITPTPPQAP